MNATTTHPRDLLAARHTPPGLGVTIRTGHVACQPGDTITLVMPYSEVCMHMRVAGKVMTVTVQDGGRMAQLWDTPPRPASHRPERPYRPGVKFSFPITTGEAGIYRDHAGLYYYPAPGTDGIPVPCLHRNGALFIDQLSPDRNGAWHCQDCDAYIRDGDDNAA